LFSSPLLLPPPQPPPPPSSPLLLLPFRAQIVNKPPPLPALTIQSVIVMLTRASRSTRQAVVPRSTPSLPKYLLMSSPSYKALVLLQVGVRANFAVSRLVLCILLVLCFLPCDDGVVRALLLPLLPPCTHTECHISVTHQGVRRMIINPNRPEFEQQGSMQ